MPHANPGHNAFDVCCLPEYDVPVAHFRMYISAFSLLSGAHSVRCKAQSHHGDVLALKREREEGKGKEREWEEKLLTPQTPLHSQWRKKAGKALSLPSLQPPARWRYYRSHLDRCKSSAACVCVCVYVHVYKAKAFNSETSSYNKCLLLLDIA